MKQRDSNRSYTSGDAPAEWLGNFWRLAVNASKHRSNMSEFVSIGIREANEVIEAIEGQGLQLRGLKMLEIGAGQLPRHLPVFARDNEVLGLDHDVVPRGFDVVGYWRMWQRNGLKRVLKTLGRKAMGYDRAFKREFARQLGLPRIREPRLLSMDATRMDLPAESYDCVYSFDVFEHLPDVGAVVRECARILKPGGVFYTYLHPVTAEDGYHDLRILASQRGDIPFWAHLRPEHRAKVKPCASSTNCGRPGTERYSRPSWGHARSRRRRSPITIDSWNNCRSCERPGNWVATPTRSCCAAGWWSFGASRPLASLRSPWSRRLPARNGDHTRVGFRLHGGFAV